MRTVGFKDVPRGFRRLHTSQHATVAVPEHAKTQGGSSCACGEGCPRCSARGADAPPPPISSTKQFHEGESDQLASAVMGAPAASSDSGRNRSSRNGQRARSDAKSDFRDVVLDHPAAWTKDGITRYRDALTSRNTHVVAHEAIHRLQFHAQSQPLGTVEQLEHEARAGAQHLLSGQAYRPQLRAPSGLTLYADPSTEQGGPSTRESPVQGSITASGFQDGYTPHRLDEMSDEEQLSYLKDKGFDDVIEFRSRNQGTGAYTRPLPYVYLSAEVVRSETGDYARLTVKVTPSSKDVFYWENPDTRLAGGGTVESHEQEHMTKNGEVYSTDYLAGRVGSLSFPLIGVDQAIAQSEGGQAVYDAIRDEVFEEGKRRRPILTEYLEGLRRAENLPLDGATGSAPAYPREIMEAPYTVTGQLPKPASESGAIQTDDNEQR